MSKTITIKKTKMTFPEDFLKRVKKEYPNTPENKNLYADLKVRDGLYVGKFLEAKRDSFEDLLHHDEVIKAFEQGREKELLEIAKTTHRRQKLYAEWSVLYIAYIKQHGLIYS